MRTRAAVAALGGHTPSHGQPWQFKGTGCVDRAGRRPLFRKSAWRGMAAHHGVVTRIKQRRPQAAAWSQAGFYLDAQGSFAMQVPAVLNAVLRAQGQHDLCDAVSQAGHARGGQGVRQGLPIAVQAARRQARGRNDDHDAAQAARPPTFPASLGPECGCALREGKRPCSVGPRWRPC